MPCHCVCCGGLREHPFGYMFESEAFLFSGRDGKYYIAVFQPMGGGWHIYQAEHTVVSTRSDRRVIER